MFWRYYILGKAPHGTLTREQRREAWRRANAAPGGQWRHLGVVAMVGVWAAAWSLVQLGVPDLIQVVDGLTTADPFQATSVLTMVAAVLIGTPPILLTIAITVHVLWRRPFFAAIQSLGHECCARCGYVLAPLDEEHPTCPECGARRRKTVCPHCGKTLARFRGDDGKCPHCFKRLADPIRSAQQQKGRAQHILDLRLRRSMTSRERWRLWCACWPIRTPARRVEHALSIVCFNMAFFVCFGALGLGLAAANDWIAWMEPNWIPLGVALAGLIFLPGLGIVFQRGNAAIVRGTARALGHNICLTCGCWLEVEPAELGHCPICETPREPAPGGEG